jgi:hypothetical protein
MKKIVISAIGLLILSGIISSCQKEELNASKSNIQKKSLTNGPTEIIYTGISIRLAGPKCAKFGVGCKKPKGDNVDWYADPIMNNGSIEIDYLNHNVKFEGEFNLNIAFDEFNVEESSSLNSLLELNGLLPTVNNLNFVHGNYTINTASNGLNSVVIPFY